MARVRTQGERGWSIGAKVLAGAGMAAVAAAVIEIVELASPGAGWAHWMLWAALVAVVYWPVALYRLARRHGDERTRATWAPSSSVGRC